MQRDEATTPNFPFLGVGIGLRPPHYPKLLASPPAIDWFEAVSENYMGPFSSQDPGREPGLLGGRPLWVLERIRETRPVVLHGVSLSIGSTDPLDERYLDRLAALAERIQPAWVSDHLCWTGSNGENLHDLLPLPYTREAIEHLLPRIARVQERLGRRVLLENVSAYLSFRHSEMTEWEFLSEIARRSDCGLLLDINNIYVSATNQGYPPLDFIEGIPAGSVGQFHLAGHSKRADGLLIDTHDHPVPDAVWALYRAALERFGAVSTLIEWDDRIPELEVLLAEAAKARDLLASIFPERKEQAHAVAHAR